MSIANFRRAASFFLRSTACWPELSPPAEGLYALCFGSVALYWQGRPVPIANKKARELLALLLFERGKLVSKAYAAQTLWPEVDTARGLDSLYKVCGSLRAVIRSGVPLPFEVRRDALWLDAGGIQSDLAQFERLYRCRAEPDCCQAAIELYAAPFAASECYEWSARAEAYYDMRYLELLTQAKAHSAEMGDKAASEYYDRLLSTFS